MIAHEGSHALDGFHGHTAADPQAAHELSIVHGAPAEGGFGHAYAPAIVGDLVKQLFSRHVVPSS
jgi:hypothetical protein